MSEPRFAINEERSPLHLRKRLLLETSQSCSSRVQYYRVSSSLYKANTGCKIRYCTTISSKITNTKMATKMSSSTPDANMPGFDSLEAKLQLLRIQRAASLAHCEAFRSLLYGSMTEPVGADSAVPSKGTSKRDLEQPDGKNCKQAPSGSQRHARRTSHRLGDTRSGSQSPRIAADEISADGCSKLSPRTRARRALRRAATPPACSSGCSCSSPACPSPNDNFCYYTKPHSISRSHSTSAAQSKAVSEAQPKRQGRAERCRLSRTTSVHL